MPAAARDDYFPVSLVAPATANRPALGFDIASEAVRRDAIQRAVSTRQPAATAAVHLVQDNEQRPGILVLYPTYRHGLRERGSDSLLLGLAVGALKTEDLVTLALGDSRVPGVRVALHDVGTSRGEGGACCSAACRTVRRSGARRCAWPIASGCFRQR